MKYRIKTRTYQSGRTEYIAQVRRFFFLWFSIGIDAKDLFPATMSTCDTLEEAQLRIDKYKAGNAKIVQTNDINVE